MYSLSKSGFYDPGRGLSYERQGKKRILHCHVQMLSARTVDEELLILSLQDRANRTGEVGRRLSRPLASTHRHTDRQRHPASAVQRLDEYGQFPESYRIRDEGADNTSRLEALDGLKQRIEHSAPEIHINQDAVKVGSSAGNNGQLRSKSCHGLAISN